MRTICGCKIKVAASNEGLFKIDVDNQVSFLAEGSYVDVELYTSDMDDEKIIAIDNTGTMEPNDMK